MPYAILNTAIGFTENKINSSYGISDETLTQLWLTLYLRMPKHR